MESDGKNTLIKNIKMNNNENNFEIVSSTNKLKINDNLNIFIRIRPPLQREIKNNSYTQCLNVKSNCSNKIYISKTNKPLLLNSFENDTNTDVEIYNFDYIFKNDSTQNELFNIVGKNSIQNVLTGYNSTIFAYGQTGSGKTFTIEGSEEKPGLLPNIFENLFSFRDNLVSESNEEITILFSALQIYLEKLTDLLKSLNAPTKNNLDIYSNTKKLIENANNHFIKNAKSISPVRNNSNINTISLNDICEDLKISKTETGFEVKNLTEIPINNFSEAMLAFQESQNQRVTASTKMNEVSSRGHVIYTLKIFHSKNLPDSSSTINKKLNKTTYSKFNIVDLAGSERITKSGTTGNNLKESISINKSLFCLQGVVDALSNKNSLNYLKPPFRDSKLTMILSDSLGGNCITSLIACVSPSISEASESLSTLQFAGSCKKILNKPIVNMATEEIKKEQAKRRLYGQNYNINKNEEIEKEKKEKLKSLPWKGFKNYHYEHKSIITQELGEIFYIETKASDYDITKINHNSIKKDIFELQIDENLNNISKNDCLINNNKISIIPNKDCFLIEKNSYKKLIILLHASPSNSKEFLHWFPALSFYGYKVIAIDQPGYGLTKGKCHPCNSLKNFDKNGPCDVVLNVLKALKITEKVIIGGYDWGAGIAISLCSKFPNLFEKAIAFLPSYAEPTGNELKCFKIPILIIWVEGDQFHLWSKWKSLADKIPIKTIEIIKIKPTNRENLGECYNKISDLILRPIVVFLGEADPLKEKEELINPIKKIENDVKGNSVQANLNINFLEDIQNNENYSNQIYLLKDKLSTEVSSVYKFLDYLKIMGWKIYDEFLSKNNKEISEIFRGLPELSDNLLTKNPNFLVQMGVWRNLPLNFENMLNMPKYFKGRKIHILIPCSNMILINGKINPEFLIYKKSQKNINNFEKNENKLEFSEISENIKEEKFLSYTGIIEDYKKNEKTFIVKTFNKNKEIVILEFPEEEIFLWNNGQNFYKNNLNQIEMEDGIRANYSNALVKAKMLEISHAISDLIEKMDFSKSEDCQIFQKQCILKIRKCLNLISFYKGVDRERHGRTDCIGKLAIKGQAQCHGLSSTIASYILPFSEILGIEVLYRGGFSFINFLKEDNLKEAKNLNIEVSNKIEKHQWLQVNFRPSMNAFLLDFWYQEQFDDEEFLCMDMQKACLFVSYPHPKLLLKNKVMKVVENELSFV